MPKEQYSEDKINELLALAAKKIGTSPQELKRRLQSGSAGDLAGSSGNDQVKKVLSNPELAKKMLDTPQAKALLKKLMDNK